MCLSVPPSCWGGRCHWCAQPPWLLTAIFMSVSTVAAAVLAEGLGWEGASVGITKVTLLLLLISGFGVWRPQLPSKGDIDVMPAGDACRGAGVVPAILLHRFLVHRTIELRHRSV